MKLTICITHSYLNNDIICTAGGVPNPQDKPFIAEFDRRYEKYRYALLGRHNECYKK